MPKFVGISCCNFIPWKVCLFERQHFRNFITIVIIANIYFHFCMSITYISDLLTPWIEFLENVTCPLTRCMLIDFGSYRKFINFINQLMACLWQFLFTLLKIKKKKKRWQNNLNMHDSRKMWKRKIFVLALKLSVF